MIVAEINDTLLAVFLESSGPKLPRKLRDCSIDSGGLLRQAQVHHDELHQSSHWDCLAVI